MNILKIVPAVLICFIVCGNLLAQHTGHEHHASASGVEAQPLLAQAVRMQEALSFLGSELSEQDSRRIRDLQGEKGDHIIAEIQKILDRGARKGKPRSGAGRADAGRMDKFPRENS